RHEWARTKQYTFNDYLSTETSAERWASDVATAGSKRPSAGRDLAEEVLPVLTCHGREEDAQAVQRLVGQGLEIGPDRVDLVPLPLRLLLARRHPEGLDGFQEEARGQAEAPAQDVHLQSIALGSGDEELVQHAVQVGQARDLHQTEVLGLEGLDRRDRRHHARE